MTTKLTGRTKPFNQHFPYLSHSLIIAPARVPSPDRQIVSLCALRGCAVTVVGREDDGGVLEAVDVVGVLLLGQRDVLVGVARREEARRARQSPARDRRCLQLE